LITIPLVGFLGIPALFSLVLLFVILFWGDRDVRKISR
jgi:hypothetical protein